MGDIETEVIEDEIIEDEIENNEEEWDEDIQISEEDAAALKKLWIDPAKATVTDLINLAKRTIKSEQKIVSEKKSIKTEIKPETNNDLELRLFFIENPDFKDDKEWIMEILSQDKYKTLTPLEAREIYKLNKPKQSEDKKWDFLGWGYKPKPKWLAEMSEEEALKLSPTEYVKRLKLRWELK